MKIAFVVNTFPVVSETFILSQIVGLIQRGYEVEIESGRQPISTGAVHADVARFNLVNRTRYPMPAAWSPRLKSAVSRLVRSGWRRPVAAFDSVNILRHGRDALNLSRLHNVFPDNRKGKYDVIHCHYGPNGRRAVAMRKAGSIQGPIITSFHGYDANSLPRIEGPLLYEGLFKHGDLFTVGSEFLRRRIVSLGAPENRIVKLRMGVDVAKYEFTQRTRASNGEFRLLTIARLVEVKGLEYALRAVSLLKARGRWVTYHIAGDGPLRQSLETLTRELSISDRVHFLGSVSQEAGLLLYKASHAFVLPSLVTRGGEEENQPVVLAEAQASGLPVVATAIGGIPESVRENESALLVPPCDPEALARAILLLADHPETWEPIGRAGRKYVEEHFNLEKLNDQLVDIYHMVQVQNGRPHVNL